MKIKKILISALLFCLILVSNSITFAKDIALDVIDGEHDCLMLATVSDIDDKYVTVEFYDTLNKTEEYIPSSIKIEKFTYSYCIEHSDNFNNPKIGDNIFVVLDKSGDVYKASNAYKTDTVDIRTLNILVPSSMGNKECMTDVAAIAYYIRSGGVHTAFAFVDNTVSIIDDNAEIVIYPVSDKTPVAIKYITGDGKSVTNSKQQDVISVDSLLPQNIALQREKLFGKRIVSLGIIFAGVISGMLVMYFVSNRRKKD